MDSNLKFSPNLVVGVVITLIGSVLVLDRLGLLEFQQALRLWPVMLILFGLSIIFDSARSVKPGENGGSRRPIVSPGLVLFLVIIGVFATRAEQGRFMSSATGSNADMSIVGIMGRDDRVIASQPFRSAQMTSVMGRATLDLRQAVLAPGTEASIDVFGMMGAIEIRVPRGWIVEMRTVAVMGGANDRRSSNAARPSGNNAGERTPPENSGAPTAPVEPAEPPAEGAPRLIINGFVLMGGVVVRS